jgi:hypothetical protein
MTTTAHHPRQSSVLQGILGKIGLAAAALAALLVDGCGGGGSLGPSTSTGDVSVSLTDSIGDFASYTVDVTSLQLVKQNGTQVSALPNTARVDFTEYTDLSEFLTVASVPSGTYTRVVLNLDYRNADVEVQDSNGIVRKAALVDGNNQPLTTLSVTLDLASGAPLTIVPGVPASFALDFDLGVSNQVLVNTSTSTVVQVEPFLIATLSLDTGREHRARGLLKDIDKTAQAFEMHLRPFAARQLEWGLITVNSATTTRYEIDGVGYVGASGLNQLATLSADTPLIVTGAVAGQKSLNATEVLAGSSVPWDSKDVVLGACRTWH